MSKAKVAPVSAGASSSTSSAAGDVDASFFTSAPQSAMAIEAVYHAAFPAPSVEEMDAITLCRKGKTRVLRRRKLINNEREANQADKFGITPIMAAAGNGHLKMIKFLMRRNADVNKADHLGFTPLHEACRFGSMRCASFLVENGAKVNAMSVGGITPIVLAQLGNSRKSSQIVDFLMKHGAQVSSVVVAEEEGAVSTEAGGEMGMGKAPSRTISIAPLLDRDGGIVDTNVVETATFLPTIFREQHDHQKVPTPVQQAEENASTLTDAEQDKLDALLDAAMNDDFTEPYIPVSVGELVFDLLQGLDDASAALTPMMSELFSHYCFHMHVDLIDEMMVLERAYAPQDPQRETIPILELRQDFAEIDQEFQEKFAELCTIANFNLCDQDDIEKALVEQSSGGMWVGTPVTSSLFTIFIFLLLFPFLLSSSHGDLYLDFNFHRNVKIDMGVFAKEVDSDHPDLRMWARGIMYKYKPTPIYFGLFVENKIIPVYKKLLIRYRLTDDVAQEDLKSAGELVTEGIMYDKQTHLRLFKDIPCEDIEIVMPHAEAVLTDAAWAAIIIPCVCGIAYVLYSALSSPDPVGLSVVGTGVATYIYKSYQTWQQVKENFRVKLNELLSHNLVATNMSVVSQIHTEAGLQEQREAILAYFFLIFKRQKHNGEFAYRGHVDMTSKELVRLDEASNKMNASFLFLSCNATLLYMQRSFVLCYAFYLRSIYKDQFLRLFSRTYSSFLSSLRTRRSKIGPRKSSTLISTSKSWTQSKVWIGGDYWSTVRLFTRILSQRLKTPSSTS